MHSIKLFSSIFATLSVALPQADTEQFKNCKLNTQLNVDIFNPGKVTEGICTNDGKLVYGLKTAASFDVKVEKTDLVNALSIMRDAARTLAASDTLAAKSTVQNLQQSCQNDVCVTLGDTQNAGQGWTAGNINDIVSRLVDWVAGNEDQARIWIGTSFALSRKDGVLTNFATGCFAPKGRNGEVPDCVQPQPVAMPAPPKMPQPPTEIEVT